MRCPMLLNEPQERLLGEPEQKMLTEAGAGTGVSIR
jgi:hypothetical protein